MTPPLPGDQGYTGVDVDGAGIDMYPDPAAKMMTDIADVFTAVKKGWDTHSKKAEDLAGKLGDGPMGEGFKEQYDPAWDAINKFVPQQVDRLGKLSKSGSEAPPLYVENDLAAGQAFDF
ncbi:hypothetical protein [Actinophytocola sp.]|uniref:hypothetical protein n=1 Tax=Actinophytocola sp. TaxID=1872138 RepID=UPI002ED1105D